MSSKKRVSKSKRPAKAPSSAQRSSSRKKDWKSQHKHLFPAAKRDFRVGRDVLPAKRDLTRFVKWPRYVRLQRQRAILKKRLSIPPTINHFAKTLDKNQATQVFRLLANHRPESPDEKKARLVAQAASESKGQGKDSGKKPRVIKFGINHVTQLIESKKAKLVVIAHDVDPIEIVVWLPALCRRMGVPYCIVKGKGRLGHLVHQKTVTCLALTDIKPNQQALLDQIVSGVQPLYLDQPLQERRKWGGGIMGHKAQAAERLRERERAREAAKQAGRAI
eukprot:TRINITY_DN34219_c0_g1_i1.p2 TRINITY_DN34219_c0_g1~~TRINITY_DN34219_c0_g1_i1.p2  ORF type:complete len:287 (-),score=47.65 TRINITY_DN34219_c0_g1_i1:53-883(-)